MSQSDVISALNDVSNTFDLRYDAYTQAANRCLELVNGKMHEILRSLSWQGKEIERKIHSSNPKPLTAPIKKLGIRLYLLATKSKQDEDGINWRTFDFNNVVKGIKIATDVDNYENYTDLDHVLIWSLAKTINRLL